MVFVIGLCLSHSGILVRLPCGAKITFLRVTKKMLPLHRQTIKHEPDKVWATIDLATLGVGKSFKLFEKAGGPVFRKAADVAEDVGYALNIRSWFMTTKNKWEKKKIIALVE